MLISCAPWLKIAFFGTVQVFLLDLQRVILATCSAACSC